MNPNHNSFWRPTPRGASPNLPSEEIFSTPNNSIIEVDITANNVASESDVYSTPILQSQFSNSTNDSISSDIFETPESTLEPNDAFSPVELRKHTNNILDYNKHTNMSTIAENIIGENSFVNTTTRSSLRENKNVGREGVMRSKSDYEIALKNKSHGFLQNIQQNIGKLGLSPASIRRINSTDSYNGVSKQSTPNNKDIGTFKIPDSPILNSHSQNSCATRAISLNSLRHSGGEQTQLSNVQQTRFVN